MDEARLRFYVRADAWAAWEALGLDGETLTIAYAESKDEKLVAAFVLETVCADLKRQAREMREQAAVQASDVQQTKSYEVVGDWKEEYFQPAQSADEARAAALEAEAKGYCIRAAQLRREATRRTVLSGRASVVVLPEVGP